ncbi:2-(1,2-epoxy-1,2-dihydrophenyl)acetyl-CoA isomerase PaaG [Vibrio sp. CAU 1672]|uniref:2-(1,2-epoxy-1,2-dihydrophenyl)acetyl-CoA isomerase PaaG n=1 Tax=Vibrio sp. CAU 1672 TaxID=3032594 RepID=UPI0023D9795A|nr:2-(1,2-epoxy-1,2-dihydrophenyl)acetyl-CoA isomerase PaaG [Vibrio sp. CAU 1672]MDF2154591.1 2-(1,2-epoxy-1,2-dihydrophenyl)acetyl-CoA isomerase PaaG [Vibrio sp. CAU 1672]
MEEEPILVQVEAGVAVITLNRPKQLNSFNPDMHKALKVALRQTEADESVRAVLLTGAGRGFCAGQDLNDRNVNSGDEMPDLGESIEKYYNPLIKQITTMPKPVIAAVNGVAAGAGANIALACDIVFAAQSASFIQAFCKIGLVPDSGGTWVLPRLVGMARAKALMLLGDKLSARQAQEWGMIWQCVDDEALIEQAMSVANHLATQPTSGLGFIKHALNYATDNSLGQQLSLEKDLQRLAGRTDDYREGIQAFFDKRAPEFKGK